MTVLDGPPTTHEVVTPINKMDLVTGLIVLIAGSIATLVVVRYFFF